MVGRSADCGSSSSSLPSASERSRQKESVRGSGNVGGERDFSYGEVRDEESRSGVCHELDTPVSFPRRTEGSSDSGSLCRLQGLVAYSEKNVLLAVSEVASSLT